MKKANVLSIGINTVGNDNDNTPGIHAEIDAIRKLQPLKIKKRLEPVNLLVVRILRNNQLKNSKPCFNCTKKMDQFSQQKGYKIKNVYYSNDLGNIIKTSPNKLLDEIKRDSNIYYSRFYSDKLHTKTTKIT